MDEEIFTTAPQGLTKDRGSRASTKGARIEDPGVDYFTSNVTKEVRRDLMRGWRRNAEFLYQEQLACIWSPGDDYQMLLERFYQMPMLDSVPQEKGFKLLASENLREDQFCNKATVFYWTRGAQYGPQAGRIILGGIWNAWCNALKGEPRMELDEFFATPVGLRDDQPATILDILEAHESLCSEVRKAMEARNVKAFDSKTPILADPKYFKLYPICEALITVFDQYTPVVEPKTDGKGDRLYEDVANKQNILLVRTGNEDKLSAPINFDKLKDFSLPLGRDEDMGATDIIRVPLLDGVRFVADLLHREQAAFRKSAVYGPTMSRQRDHPTEKWRIQSLDSANKRLARVQSEGTIPRSSSAKTVRKALYLDESESQLFSEPYPFWVGWA